MEIRFLSHSSVRQWDVSGSDITLLITSTHHVNLFSRLTSSAHAFSSGCRDTIHQFSTCCSRSKNKNSRSASQSDNPRTALVRRNLAKYEFTDSPTKVVNINVSPRESKTCKDDILLAQCIDDFHELCESSRQRTCYLRISRGCYPICFQNKLVLEVWGPRQLQSNNFRVYVARLRLPAKSCRCDYRSQTGLRIVCILRSARVSGLDLTRKITIFEMGLGVVAMGCEHFTMAQDGKYRATVEHKNGFWIRYWIATMAMQSESNHRRSTVQNHSRLLLARQHVFHSTRRKHFPSPLRRARKSLFPNPGLQWCFWNVFIRSIHCDDLFVYSRE